MRYRIYHGLDRRSSVFGIHGRFISLTVAGGVISAFLALVIGKVTAAIMGVLVLLAGSAASYLLTLGLQSRISERDLMKAVLHRSMPQCWSMPEKTVRNLWKGIN